MITRDDINVLIEEVFLNDDAPKLIYAAIIKHFNPTANKGRNLTDQLYIQSGRLAKSLKKGNPDNIYNASILDNTIEYEYGSKVIYAAIHEHGGSTGRNYKSYMPPRPYLSLGLEDFKNEWFSKMVKKFSDKLSIKITESF